METLIEQQEGEETDIARIVMQMRVFLYITAGMRILADWFAEVLNS